MTETIFPWMLNLSSIVLFTSRNKDVYLCQRFRKTKYFTHKKTSKCTVIRNHGLTRFPAESKEIPIKPLLLLSQTILDFLCMEGSCSGKYLPENWPVSQYGMNQGLVLVLAYWWTLSTMSITTKIPPVCWKLSSNDTKNCSCNIYNHIVDLIFRGNIMHALWRFWEKK